MACADGSTPTTSRSDCEPCPSAQAGQDGVCEQCGHGTQPRIDEGTRETIADRCVACTDAGIFNTSRGWVSEDGASCVPCHAGRAPNAENTDCHVCVPGKVSSVGVDCQWCAPGLEPNTIAFGTGATHCTVCLNGTHRHNEETGGALDMQSCSTCVAGQEPNDAANDCVQCSDTSFSDGSACVVCDAGSQPNAE